MKKYFESDEILSLLWRWKKHFLIVFSVAFLASALFSSSMFIRPKFKSFAQVYPANLQKYSDESATEQMLQFLESGVIRDSLCAKFDLAKRYGIEADDPHFKDLLYREYNDNVHFKKTKYESVEISVLDYTPDTAYQMVNTLLSMFNFEVKRLQDEKLLEAVKTIGEMVRVKKIEMDSLEAGINRIRRDFGILDFGSQVKNLSREYYRLLARGGNGTEKVSKVRKELDNLEEKGVEYESLSGRLWSARDSYNSLKIQYQQQEKELRRKKGYTMEIVKPYRSDKKTYPVRWLIVVISVGVTMLAAIGVISFIDRIDRQTAE